MRIVSWNCNGALRNKLEVLTSLNADVYIIQECENPLSHNSKVYQQWAGNFLWEGENKSRGLGVFAKKALKLERIEIDAQGLQLFIPFKLNHNLQVLAVWTKQANSPTFGYIGQLWKYLQNYKHVFSNDHSLIMGDFNSNTCWDLWDRWWNHSDVVKELAEIGLVSAYHELCGELQGAETQATFFMYRKPEKPYHIDYAFLPKPKLLDAKLILGDSNYWLKYSDHVPLVLDIDNL